MELEPFRYYEEPELDDYEALDAEQDTRAANDADDVRKEKP